MDRITTAILTVALVWMLGGFAIGFVFGAEAERSRWFNKPKKPKKNGRG